MFFPYEHNIANNENFLSCQQLFWFQNVFKVFLTFPALRVTPVLRHKPETLPGKRDNVSPYEQNKIIWLAEVFSR
jgi:hypothetical protein